MSISTGSGDLYNAASRLLGGGFITGLGGVPKQLGAAAPTSSPDFYSARGRRVFNYFGGPGVPNTPQQPPMNLPTGYVPSGPPSSAAPPGLGGGGSGGGTGPGTDSLTMIIIIALIALVIWGRKK